MTAGLLRRVLGLAAFLGLGAWAYNAIFDRGAESVQAQWDLAKAQAEAAAGTELAGQARRNADITATDAQEAINYVQAAGARERRPDVLLGRLERMCSDAGHGAGGSALRAAAPDAGGADGADHGRRQRPGADAPRADPGAVAAAGRAAAEPIPTPSGLARLAIEDARCVDCCDQLAALQAAQRERERIWAPQRERYRQWQAARDAEARR